MLFFFSFVKTNFIKENLGKFQQLIIFFCLQQYIWNGIWISSYSRYYRSRCSLRVLSSAYAWTRPRWRCWDHSNPNWSFGINNFYGQWRSWHSSQHDCLISVFVCFKKEERRRQKPTRILCGKFSWKYYICAGLFSFLCFHYIFIIIYASKNIIFIPPLLLFIDLFCLL